MRTILKYIFPVITLVILIVAVWLSHQPGDISGMESSRIAAFLGVSDTFLRSACHYVLFFLITICCGVSLVLWEKPLWWLLFILPLCWLDEASKPLIMGRHFSWIDSGKNAIGAIAGMVVTILLSFVCRRG
mgnify:CR=1 FL=1